jgi:hypothetical protein
MAPVAIAFMAIGALAQGAAKAQADRDQAAASRRNADWFREQADYARFVGDRDILLFDRQSKVTFGEQRSAFAKAGVDTAESSRFLAEQELYGQQESNAKTKERDMNVRLASLKAEQADQEAFQLDSAAQWDMFSGVMGAGTTIAQGNAGGYGLNNSSNGGGNSPGIFTRVN